MIDIKLDENGDLVVENGDAVLITESEEVAQALTIHLKTIAAEWLLDVGIGVDYFGKIYPIEVPKTEKELFLKKEILSVVGVKNILSFSFEIDIVTKVAVVNFEATTDYGRVIVEVSA